MTDAEATEDDPGDPVIVQFRSAGAGERLAEAGQPAVATAYNRDPPESVEYERGDLIREHASDPRAPIAVEAAEDGTDMARTQSGLLPVTDAESANERAAYRVLYDDERLSDVTWDLPSFNFYLPVACPECGGLAWGFHHTETREAGDPTNTKSTEAATPWRRRRAAHYIEYRCNECESKGHKPANKIANGGIAGE